MRTGLLSDLSVIGYEVFLEGENIKLRYQKPDTPPDAVKPLIDELRRCKAEAVNILRTGNTITPTKKTQLGAKTTVIWRNPYPQGTPEARQASLESIIEAMLYGIHPADDEQNRQINDMARDVLLGKAKLADFQRLLGFLH